MGNDDVFKTVRTQELVVGKGTVLSTPSTNSDDLIIYGGTNGGMSIISSTAGRVSFGDAASNAIGEINYDHATDAMIFTVAGVNVLRLQQRFLDIRETSDTTPTVVLSGALFVSGGGLYYKGFTGTISFLGAS